MQDVATRTDLAVLSRYATDPQEQAELRLNARSSRHDQLRLLKVERRFGQTVAERHRRSETKVGGATAAAATLDVGS